MIEYMSKAEVADHLGLSIDAIKSYVGKGYMPEPDARIGRISGWTTETIDRWYAERPGRGARTDCRSWTTTSDGTRVYCERTPAHAGKHRHGDQTW